MQVSAAPAPAPAPSPAPAEPAKEFGEAMKSAEAPKAPGGGEAPKVEEPEAHDAPEPAEPAKAPGEAAKATEQGGGEAAKAPPPASDGAAPGGAAPGGAAEPPGGAADGAKPPGPAEAARAEAEALLKQGAQTVQDAAAAAGKSIQHLIGSFEPTFEVSGSVGTKYGSEEVSLNRTWAETSTPGKPGTPDYMLQHKTQDSSYSPGLSVSVGFKPVKPEGDHADNPIAQAMAGIGFQGVKASAELSADTTSKNNQVTQLDLSTGEVKNKTYDSGAKINGSVSFGADFSTPAGNVSAKVTPIDAAIYKSGSYDVTSSSKISRSSPDAQKLGVTADLANDKTTLSATARGGQKVAEELTATMLGADAVDDVGGVNWEKALPMAGDRMASFGMSTLGQLPGMGVKALAESGRALAGTTEAAAQEVLKTGAYVSGNAMHHVRNGLGADGGHQAGMDSMNRYEAHLQAEDAANVDAGDVFGKVSEAADGFNAGVGRVVDATGGSAVNILRAAAGGENIFQMTPQELEDGGYRAFKNTQDLLKEGAQAHQANPLFRAPSLPSSPQEALARITPK